MMKRYAILFTQAPETIGPCERRILRVDSYRMFEPYELVLVKLPAAERIEPQRFIRAGTRLGRAWQWFRTWVLRRPGPKPFCGLIVEDVYIGGRSCLKGDEPAEKFGPGYTVTLPVVLEGDDITLVFRNDGDHPITITATVLGRLIENVVHLPRAYA